MLLLYFAQIVVAQNIHFYPETDTVHAVDGCTGVEFTCTLSSFSIIDSIIITPGFNTFFEYLDTLGNWLPIDKFCFLIDDTVNTFQYKLFYLPLGPLPYFAPLIFDSTYIVWDNYFKIVLVVSSLGTVIDSSSQVFKSQIGIGIEDKDRIIVPEKLLLYPTYPNPFNSQTTINYYLPRSSKIKISLFNSLGQLKGILLNKERVSGRYNLNWKADPELPSGIYYIVLDNGLNRSVRKILVQK
jgi:hypothetical protein